jgi:hypothetical protein
VELRACRPPTALYNELYSDARSAAGEGPPIDHSRPRPEVAAERFEQNKTSRFPNSLRGHAGAMGTDVMRCSGLRAPAVAKVGKLYRFGQNSPRFPSDASVGHSGHLAEWGHLAPPYPHDRLESYSVQSGVYPNCLWRFIPGHRRIHRTSERLLLWMPAMPPSEAIPMTTNAGPFPTFMFHGEITTPTKVASVQN